MKNLKVCVDLDNAFDHRLFGLYNSLKERDSNVFNENFQDIAKDGDNLKETLEKAKEESDFHILKEDLDNQEKLTELALYSRKLWENGRTLKVLFLEGDEFLKKNVVKFAKTWELYANIQFEFVSEGPAEIRVSFMRNKGSWSYVGTDALNITDQNEPTMNFGWFNKFTPQKEFSRTVIHEFGHALGCIHEHMSPAAAINWNKPVVYEYYERTQTPPWDKEKVDNNLFTVFDQSEISNSNFDPQSIMLYPIPPEFTLDGFSVGMNSGLSKNDMDFMALSYPKLV